MYNQFTQNYLLTAADCDVVDTPELIHRLESTEHDFFHKSLNLQELFFVLHNYVYLAMLLLKVKKISVNSSNKKKSARRK